MNKTGHLRILLILIVIVATELCLCGCGSPRRPGMSDVSGLVTLDGQPIAEGFITFESVDASYPPESAPIKLGQYKALARRGKSIVRIIASRQIGEQDFTAANPPAWEDYIPARYNERSELVAEIEPQGTNEIDFDLRSEPGK